MVKHSLCEQDQPPFSFNEIVCGDSRRVMETMPAESVDLSFWSPPYFVGKSYERDMSFEDWRNLILGTAAAHGRVLRKGGFMVVNISDILCFPDPKMPRYQADNVSGKKHKVTRADVLRAKVRNPDAGRYRLAEILGCSEQTVQRRLENNNVRGGKACTSTKVFLTGDMIAKAAEQSGLYLYDRRVWHKDPCWMNSRWHSASYRAVDEFEYLYIFWRPGIVSYERDRLTAGEWADWGSRGVWRIASVRKNDRHEAEFPEQLAERVIRLFSPADGAVLDPFVGSGTTTAVAARLGRKWVGVDLNEGNAAMARERVNNAGW